MSQYITIADLKAQIPPLDLIAAFNDDNSGSENDDAINLLCQQASAKVDARLANVYALPFNPVPQPVYDAALNIACYMVYRRIKAGKENNPFQADYDSALAWLKEMAESDKVGLDQSATRAYAPAAIFTEGLSTWGTTA